MRLGCATQGLGCDQNRAEVRQSLWFLAESPGVRPSESCPEGRVNHEEVLEMVPDRAYRRRPRRGSMDNTGHALDARGERAGLWPRPVPPLQLAVRCVRLSDRTRTTGLQP